MMIMMTMTRGTVLDKRFGGKRKSACGEKRNCTGWDGMEWNAANTDSVMNRDDKPSSVYSKPMCVGPRLGFAPILVCPLHRHCRPATTDSHLSVLPRVALRVGVCLGFDEGPGVSIFVGLGCGCVCVRFGVSPITYSLVGARGTKQLGGNTAARSPNVLDEWSWRSDVRNTEGASRRHENRARTFRHSKNQKKVPFDPSEGPERRVAPATAKSPEVSEQTMEIPWLHCTL